MHLGFWGRCEFYLVVNHYPTIADKHLSILVPFDQHCLYLSMYTYFECLILVSRQISNKLCIKINNVIL